MKTIKTTHIDTGGHGYYSVSKKDVEFLGIKDKITGYSGLSFNRVYLEEDSDGTLLYEAAKDKGVNVVCKSGYNLNFKVTHNYAPELFNWTPAVGEVVEVGGNNYTIKEIDSKKLVVVNAFGGRYKIPTSNPFKYIEKLVK